MPTSPKCCLCNQPIETNQAWDRMVDVPFEASHPLYSFCNAPFHFSCMATWLHRQEFSQGYLEMFREMHEGGIGYVLASGERWLLGCGALGIEHPEWVEITLADWPLRLRCENWKDWEQFVQGGFRVGVAPECLPDAEAVMAQVREVAGEGPMLDALLHHAAQNTTRIER